MYRDPHSNVEASSHPRSRPQAKSARQIAIELLAERDAATVQALMRRKWK